MWEELYPILSARPVAGSIRSVALIADSGDVIVYADFRRTPPAANNHD